MLDDEIDVPTSSKKKLEKSQLVDNLTVTVDGKKSEKSDGEDPKPRIVLTFRSEKSGSKNSNMKIVSSEEKHEEFSPRRSSRTRSKWEWSDDAESSISPNKKDKSVSENEEVSDSSAPKRSSRRRSKDSSDNVLANAIARKEKSYDTVPTQRLSRRIKPTAKVLENEELRIGFESQNNARLGIQSEKEEGVRTRRSARPAVGQSLGKSSNSTAKPDTSGDQDDSEKLRHLCELGLKVKDEVKEDMEEDAEEENRDSDENECEIVEEDEEIDDDSEVISKLLEADDETVSEGDDDDDFSCSEEASQTDKGPRTRRSTRLNSSLGNNDSDESTVPDGDKTPPRRSSRRSTRHHYDEEINQDLEYVPRRKKTRLRGEEPQPEPAQEDNSNPAGGDEGSEAACPEDDSAVVATCFCAAPSNVYAAPDELAEPVFCQAIETVDGVRVGCSHLARLVRGQLAAMLRAGPRTPYLLACALHAEQLARHMCCVACGLFCTQGIFYQCSEKHLFHIECGLPYNEAKSTPGCPHCGVRSYRWSPANTQCVRVRVEMKCSNKRTLLAEPRQQSTPAYLTFSTLPEPLKQDPIISEDLMPAAVMDLLKVKVEGVDELTDDELLQNLREAIVAGESVESLASKIASVRDINAVVDAAGSTCAHCAARRGDVRAAYVLACAGAQLDACDHAARTPLLLAVQALLDQDGLTKSPKHLKNHDKSTEDMEVDQAEKEEITEEIKKESQETETSKEVETNEETEVNKEEIDISKEEIDVSKEIKEEPIEVKEEIIKVDKPVPEERETGNEEHEDNMFKMIRFLVASGRCDVNFPGPEGMTALHLCASRGGARAEAIARELLMFDARVDAKDHGGWTPLVWAAEHGHAGIVRLLLQNGADATLRDKEGNGVVHWCVLGGHSSCLLQLLTAAPGTVEHCNQHGDTPLHIAARHGHYSCVVILLARGARTDIANAAGEFPLDVCEEHDSCRNAIAVNIQMGRLSSKAGKHRLLCTDISRGREQFPVPCVNELDDTLAPEDFTYVTSHVMSENIVIDNTISTLQGCSCAGGSCSDSSCSCVVLGVRRWYRGGRLHPAFSYHEPPMLFECNCTCKCSENECGNKLVTHLTAKGSLGIRACVFRCRAGWGLRARELVCAGSLVAVYCGELLALEAADARVDDQYMFALDVKPDLLEQCSEKTMLCVDAAKYGSAARFINHSCSANLVPVRVFTSTRDLRLPTIALFACRDIKPDEELTFDYGEKFWSVKAKWMKCECGTAECRYPETIKEEEEI